MSTLSIKDISFDGYTHDGKQYIFTTSYELSKKLYADGIVADSAWCWASDFDPDGYAFMRLQKRTKDILTRDEYAVPAYTQHEFPYSLVESFYFGGAK